jgi:outer membrane protein assembly factor BamB/tetratricopeptide (TPR) repeat protein
MTSTGARPRAAIAVLATTLAVLVLPLAFRAASFAQIQPGPLARPGSTFHPDTSYAAKNLLRNAANHVRESQWPEAVDLYQRVIEKHGDDLAEAPRDDAGEAGDSLLYVNVRQYCQAALAALPPEGLALYRQRVDAKAQQLYDKALETGDEAALRRVIGEYLASSWADQAVDHLGDLCFRRGEFAEALRAYRLLLPAPSGPQVAAALPLACPTPDVDLARVAAKILLCRAALGDVPTPAEIEAFRNAHPNAQGKLAGRSGPLHEILAQALDDDRLSLPQVREPRWPTFAGAPDRNGVAPEKIDVGSFQWKIGLADSSGRSGPDPENFRGFTVPVRPRGSEEIEPRVFPIVVGDQVIVSDEDRLTAYHLNATTDATTDDEVRKDTIAWEQRLSSPYGVPSSPRASSPPARHTISASGDRVFARLGPVGKAGGGTLIAVRNNQEIEGKLLWRRPAADITLPTRRAAGGEHAYASYEGSPVAGEDHVYIALTEAATETWVYVACLDAETGQTVWIKYLGNASSAVDAARNAQLGTAVGHRLLTLSGDALYYLTNMGATACLDARTGDLRWLATYPVRERATGSDIRRGLNPAVVHQGVVIIAPEDSPSLFALDSATGQTLWKSQPIPQIVHLLGVGHGKVFATGDRVYTLDFHTGKVLRVWPEGGAGFEAHGRGLLAADSIYWPTRTEVHVLDQATGGTSHSTIPLFQSFGHGGGNLAVGNGYLVVAQRDKLVVFCQNRRLIERYRMQIAREPHSALNHYQLARVAETAGDHALALESLQEAARLATADDLVDGLLLADVARSRQHELQARLGEKAVAAKDWTTARKLYRMATQTARNDRERLAARMKLVSVQELAGEIQPAIDSLQEILEDPALARLTVPADSNRSIRADLWVAETLARLLDTHGRQNYAAHDQKAEALLERGRSENDPRILREVARLYPVARVAPESLAALARIASSQGRHADAVAACKQLLFTASNDPQRARALIALGDAYEAQGSTSLARTTYQRASSLYGGVQLPPPGEPGTTASLASARLERLAAHDATAAAPLDPSFGPFLRRWSHRFETPARPILAESHDPKPDAPPLFLVQGNTLRPVDPVDGQAAWQADLAAEPIWVAAHGGLVLCATATSIQALRRDTGERAWRFDPATPHTAASPPDPFNRAPAPIDAGGAPPSQSRATGRLHAFKLQGSRLFFLRGDHTLLSIDADDGRLAWSYSIPPAGNSSRGINANWVLTQCNAVLQVGKSCAIVSLDLESGILQRRDDLEDENALWDTPPVPFDDSRILVAPNPRSVALYDLDRGTFLWTFHDDSALPRAVSPALFAQEGVVLAIFGGQDLVRLDPSSGRRLWRRALGLDDLSDRPGALIIDEARAFCASGTNLTAYRLADGSTEWSRRLLGPESGWTLALVHGALAVLPQPAPSGTEPLDSLPILFCRCDSGQLVQRMVLGAPVDTLAVHLDDHRALIATQTQLWAFSRSSGSFPDP